MARSSRNSAAAALAVALVLAASVSASAHRRDEYLQAARIAIDPGRVRVEIDLTPGISVAEDVLRDIDRDRDGAISTAEADAYVGRIAAGVSLDVDGAPLRVQVTGRAFPAVGAIRNGEGVIQIQFAAPIDPLAPGAHRLHFRNTNRPDIGVYLANALVPVSDRVTVTNQSRDYNQRSLDVDYLLHEDGREGWWRVGLAAAGLVALLAVIVQ